MPVCMTPPSASKSLTCQTCGRSTATNHVLMGFYSRSAELACGSWEVLTVDNTWVRITAMLDDPSAYKWTDKKYVNDVITGSNRNHRAPSVDPDEFGAMALRINPVPAPRVLNLGDTCPKCRAEVKERQLLTSTYVGCMC